MELEIEETAKLKEELFIRNVDEAEPILPIVSIVRRYFGRLPMAAGTGATMDMAVRMLTATKLYSYFDVIVSADDVVNHKPAPDTFLKCAEKMHVAPESCQVFEDGQMGIIAARRQAHVANCPIRALTISRDASNVTIIGSSRGVSPRPCPGLCCNEDEIAILDGLACIFAPIFVVP